MPFVKCSVDGCNYKAPADLEADPRDRETWVYRECDICFPARLREALDRNRRTDHLRPLP